MTQPQVTILVPNYKTLELTKLCLRLLRKYTDPNKAKVVVIDNDSQDASLDYLRTLSWITLIERKAIPGESPAGSHSQALDLALDQVTTPYVLSIHTDTLVKGPQWLEFLIAQIEKNPRIAGVGSWKLEEKPIWERGLKWIEECAQLLYYKIINKQHHQIQGVGDNYYYLRSHCALYRMAFLRQLNVHFADGDMVAGKSMHKSLVDAGYEMIFLSTGVLIKYLDHINHATMALNPQLGSRQKTVVQGIERIQKTLAKMRAHEILADASLDC